jgi:hypothetical protein
MTENELPEDFNEEDYLVLNPDVKKAGADPVEHYLSSGRSEGRGYKRLHQLPEDFNAEDYLILNPDVKEAKVDPVQHYLSSGHTEGRRYKRIPEGLRPKIDTPYEHDGLKSIHNHDFMKNSEFTEAYERGVRATGTDYKWFWRVHIGLWAAQSALRVSGDYVECGVNKGFLSSSIMKALDWDQTERTFYLLDTFSGLDERYISEHEIENGVLERNRSHLDSEFYTSKLESVRKNFSEWNNVIIVPGSIPETLNQIKSDKIAFLHIDLNCSSPEVATIEDLWSRIEHGGIVLLDDYAYYGYQTQKDGMDAWAATKNVPIASLPTGQGLIIKA